MVNLSLNPWGVAGGQEAQRADLWTLSLGPVISEIEAQPDYFFEAIGLSRGNLPSADESIYYPANVSIPSICLDATRVIQGSTPRYMPGYTNPTDQARIDFVHDNPENPAQSRILTLLLAWRALSRTGILPGIPLQSFTQQINFRFSLVVQLLAGSSDEFGVSGPGLEKSAAYQLVNCWISSIRAGKLDRGSSAEVHIISASVQPQEIISL